MYNGSKELHDKSLDSLLAILPNTFERIHKSYIVRISEVKEVLVHSGNKYELILNNELILPIGRTRYKEVKQRWE